MNGGGGSPRLTASATGISAMYGGGSGGGGGVTRDRPSDARSRNRRGGPSSTSTSPATPLTPSSRTSPTATWGPLLWNAIHTLTWYDLSEGALTDWWCEFVNMLVEHLPCEECATHLRKWIVERPFVIDTSEAVHEWFVDLHNCVNARHQKPEWNATTVANHYGRHVDTGIALINLYTGLADLDDYMDESVSERLRQMINVLMS